MLAFRISRGAGPTLYFACRVGNHPMSLFRMVTLIVVLAGALALAVVVGSELAKHLF